MFDPSSIVVGLEVGTSKICVVVGDVNAQGALRVLGVGQAESRGVRKGEIINPAELPDLLRHAIHEAEEMSDVEIRSVWLGVSGGHIESLHNRGIQTIASDDREISPDDIREALRTARTVNMPPHNHTLHLIRQDFIVDGQSGVENPVGMHGHRLEAEVLVIHGNFNRLQNAVKAVKALHLEVDDIVFSGLGSQLAVLSPAQKELGSLVLDLGAGTTEYLVTEGGVVRHAGVLAVGGDHVSQDLALGLKVPLGLADQLKIEQGAALMDEGLPGATITLPNDNGLPTRSINLDHLRKIMSVRMEETLEVIAHRLTQLGLATDLRGGVVLCGGGARTPGLTRLVSRIFQTSAELGRIYGVAGMTSALDQPEFAAPVGLAKYGSFQLQKRLTEGGRWSKRWSWPALFGRAV